MISNFTFGLLIATSPILLTQSAIAATLIPTNSIGSVRIQEQELHISTGTGGKAASSLGDWLRGDRNFLKLYGTEGSIAMFKLKPGNYQIEWQFYTSEKDGDDVFLLWNGKQLTELATSAIATIKQTRTYNTSDWLTSQISTTGDLGLIALDTTDKKGTSIWKVRSIEKVPEPSSAIALIGVLASLFYLKRIPSDL
jgi:hypothetical protein